ncbi:hypothetical protein WG906_03825 [Pedobacter sp. P351]|uniref:hypothetical protein n=1 Tax=Pedobacter superstes TaxID=3133441 RepID=UPI0030B31480
MKALPILFIFLLIQIQCIAQNVAGKWYGKITQKAGGYSELYDLELDLSQKKNITGESYAFIPNVLHVKIGLKGYIDGDTIRLLESLYDIREEFMPLSWIACIKNLNLKYYKQGNSEFLKGVWNGNSKEDRSPCLPGEIILSKSKPDLEEFIAKDGFQQPFLKENIKPRPDFTPTFLSTEIKKVKELEVHSKQIELRLNDYMKVDNDIVSIYFNRQAIASNKPISKKQIRLLINMDPGLELNEIILFAENLGRIPPNTSRLIIIDGNITHQLVIESDKQKTAAIYLKYKP